MCLASREQIFEKSFERLGLGEGETGSDLEDAVEAVKTSRVLRALDWQISRGGRTVTWVLTI